MTESVPDRPPTLFLMLDSMRADRLSLYGHDRSTTPNLAALADQATVYENAVAPATWTLPSHGSMFTGLYPSAHGVTNGFLDATGELRLPGETTTVASDLAARGYRTAGFSNNPWVGGLSGLDAGFETFVEWNLEIGAEGPTSIHSRRDRLYSRLHSVLGHAARQPLFLLKRRFFTANLVERATRWLDSSDDPPFAFLNLMEAHSPYFPPRSAFRALGLPAPGPLEPRLLNTRLLAYVMGKTTLDEEQRRRALEYYDASLRYQDRKVGELLDTFRSAVDFEDALVVVCADHGKTLGEYDRDATPPHYLRDINVTVPLVVKYPGQTDGERVDDVVELRRIADLLRDGGTPPLEARGERDPDGERRAVVEEFVPHTGREREAVTRWRALVGPDYKFCRSDEGETALFERTPPGIREEEVDDAEIERSLSAALDARVDRLDAAGAPTAAAGDGDDLESDVAAQLEDLGYL
jgi:arylsulfatase A-like enzyme